MTKVCLYCKKEKSKSEFSQEHILPKAIGGNLRGYNPFSIKNVCIKCNNLCGLFVDAPFVKNWMINNNRSEVSKKYCNITSETVLPLVFIGKLENISFKNKICDFWLGPTGDCIYHFHDPYPDEEDIPIMVGISPTLNNKKIDYGFVFIFIRSNNPIWHPTIINSVLANFKSSTFYLGNGPKPDIPKFSEIPSELYNLQNNLNGLRGKQHHNKVKISIDYADRFLCKLALGFGYITLGDDFTNSPYADKLRKALWEKNSNERKKIKLRGSNFLSHGENKKNIEQILQWKGGHLFAVMNFNNRIGLYCNFYERNSAVIQISNNIQLLKDKNINGLVYVVSPTLNKVVGPLPIEEFISHINTPTYSNLLLQSLEIEMNKYDSLPPFDI